MEEDYNHKEVEARISRMWDAGNYFTPRIDLKKKPFSMFLAPPNASGGMHIGNVFMIAVQDILARYHRAKGDPTLWIPGTDHGGYETQVTFERELEREGGSRYDYRRRDLYAAIENFVERNNELIKSQIKAMGASVDWTRFRYTLDERAVLSALNLFRKMVSDNLIYRRPYVVNYCFSCGTVLADIELGERKEKIPLYHVKFFGESGDEYLTLATTRPEYLFATTHIIIHPADTRHARHIGKRLRNPVTGEPVEVLADSRKFVPPEGDPPLAPLAPSYKSYDYGYALRHSLPARSLLDWDGRMIERYPGATPAEAREREVSFLEEKGLIEKVDGDNVGAVQLCKRGHAVEGMMMLTWFLKLDDEKTPIRKPAVEAIRKTGLNVIPRWREKGLIGWMEKMHDWPIARQNVWGIPIPVWYDVSDPSRFTVWFFDKDGNRRYGNLKEILDGGISLEEVTEGLERIYAAGGASWTLNPEAGKKYLPETDTFDTWFSSGNWSLAVYGDHGSRDLSYFFPSEVVITGHDLLRLFISRMILFGYYLTGKLPFRTVYLHRLLKGADGQKMSKSLGNAVNPEDYLDKYGSDVTRMALVSYTNLPDDFIFTEDRLLFYESFSRELWEMGRLVTLANQYSPEFSESLKLSRHDEEMLAEFERLATTVSSSLDRYFFASAQEAACAFLSHLEDYAREMKSRGNVHISLSVLRHLFGKYLALLHPFMPFMTEELYSKLYKPSVPLAVGPWPGKR